MTFGDWLRETRKRANISLEALGSRADCSRNYLSSLERNLPDHRTGRLYEPSRNKVEAIALALEAELGEALLTEALRSAGYAPLTDTRGPDRDVEQASRELGRRIQARRETLQLDPDTVANLLKIPVQDYLLYERGEAQIAAVTLAGIARVLRIPVNHLVPDQIEDWQPDEGPIEAYFAGIAPEAQTVVREMIVAAFRAGERSRTTHGKKAE